MRIINKKYLLIILLVGVLFLTGVIILKPTREVKLDNVILKQEVNNKTFAMYKEDNENNYVPVTDTKFPEGYALNVTESNCIDNNGNKIKDALSYENGEVTITSGKTIYCYLYFDKTFGIEIKEKEPKGLKTDAIRGAMYRFQGQQNDGINNYICFGTSDLKTCTDNQDKYMYRIIGIEASTGRVKVIKMKPLDKKIVWADNYGDDIKFPDSKIYEAINGDKFLTNTDYVPEGWKEKISDNTWTYGDMLENDNAGAKQTGQGLYEAETGQQETKWHIKSTLEDGGIGDIVDWEGNTESYGQTLYYKEESGKWKGEEHKVTSKISLMYLHDYSYSVGDDAKCNFYYGDTEYAKCKLGWIHLSNNDDSALNPREWTMSRASWLAKSGAFYGFAVDELGSTSRWILENSFSVRPVFYIDASQSLKDGTGTITDPFIIK